MNSEKMCDCNQGRLPCSCKAVPVEMLSVPAWVIDQIKAELKLGPAAWQAIDEALQAAEQRQGEPTCRGDQRLGTACGKCSRCLAASAPKCETCNDHGAVGNILNAEPCPDCTSPRNLIAQLQADLTVRDELIDQLRSGHVFETGPYEVELSDSQWSAALDVLENYNMGDDKHFVFLEEQGRGVISEILIGIGVARAPDADEVAE